MGKKTKKDPSELIARFVLGLIGGGGAFAILWFWNTWELSLPVLGVIAAVIGLLIMALGGNLLKIWNGLDWWA